MRELSSVSPSHPSYQYSLADQDAWSTTSSGHHHAKRQRSLGLSSRIGSLSRRWKNRSGAGPQLSIITSTAPAPSFSRASFDAHATRYSRSASIASTSQDIYSPASMHSFAEETIPESEVVPIYIDHRSTDEHEEEQGQATTPLLPPTMINLQKQDSPIHSPLQSPSMAPTTYGHNRLSSDNPPFSSHLPSPPLSTRPSVASMPRSRANTATLDIPALQLLTNSSDPWAARLGHADFSIHPEPYRPDTVDLDSYKEFRDNWDQARKQYAQHLARTTEHYGQTSKVYKLTEEKWTLIDDTWKKYNAHLSMALSPQLARLSDDPHSPDSPVSLLEKPVTRVVVPQLDKSGKFPEIGDADIVGPLSIGVAKVPELQRGPVTPPLSPRKRNFMKFFELFSR